MRLLACLLVVWPSLGSAGVLGRAVRPAPAARPLAPTVLLPLSPSPSLTPSVALAAPNLAAAPSPAAAPALAPLAAAFPAPADAPAPAPGPAPAAPAGAADKDAALDLFFDGSAPMRRPLEESWVVGGTVYGSTRDLLRGFAVPPEGAAATYRFAHEPSRPRNRASHAAVSALAGAAVMGAVLAVVSYFVTGPDEVLRAVLSLDLVPGETGLLLTPLVLATGAFLGAVMSWDESGKPGEPEGARGLTGLLLERDGPAGRVPVFVVRRGKETASASLIPYAYAEPLEEPRLPETWHPLASALAGAALGVVTAVAHWIPLVQMPVILLAGPAIGGGLAHALAKTDRAPWAVLGGALGVVIPLMAFLSFSAVSPHGFLAAAGYYAAAMAVLGALLGLLAANAVRDADARERDLNPADQWWADRSR